MMHLKIFIAALFCFTLFSCQKKQMAYFQQSDYENYSSEKKSKELPVQSFHLENITPKTPNLIVIDSVYTQSKPEIVNIEPNQTSIKPQKKLRKKLLLLSNQLVGIKKDSLSNSPDDEAKYQKKGKTAGILGLTSIGLILIGFLAAAFTMSSSLMLLVPAFFIGIIGGIMGLSANKHLKGKKSTMARVGIGAGVIFAILFIVLLAAATQFSLSD